MIAYFADNMWQAWAVVAVLGLLLELMSGDFFILCFSIGATGAALASLFTGFYVQLIVFAVVTALSITQVRPFALRYLHRNDPAMVSNADALLQRTGRVTETIPAGGYGRVAIDGDVWKARSQVEYDIPAGASVRVVGRVSTIITVVPEEEQAISI